MLLLRSMGAGYGSTVDKRLQPSWWETCTSFSLTSPWSNQARRVTFSPASRSEALRKCSSRATKDYVSERSQNLEHEEEERTFVVAVAHRCACFEVLVAAAPS